MAAEARQKYKRLPGRGRRLSGRFITGESQRLFLGERELVILRVLGYQETNKRIALSDIQAITIQSNSDRMIVTLALLLIAMMFLGFGGLMAAIEAGEEAIGFFVGCAMIPLFFLVPTLAPGPTCTVRLHTAVQVEELTALRRLRAARKCLAILVPRIEAVQGAAFTSLDGVTARASAAAKGLKDKKAPKVIGRSMHSTAFGLELLLGAMMVAQLVFEGPLKDAIDSILLVAATIALIVAAIRQANSTIPRRTSIWTWTMFLYNGFAYMTLVYAGIFAVMSEAMSTGKSPANPIEMTANLSSNMPPWVGALNAALGAVMVALALFGFSSMRGYRVIVRQPNDAGGVAP